MATLFEVRNDATRTISVTLVGISESTKEELKGLLFVRCANNENGMLETFVTTEDRAQMFSAEQLINRDNIGRTLKVLVRDIPKATATAIPAYKTNKAVEIEGVKYAAGDLVPYRRLDGYKVLEGAFVPNNTMNYKVEVERYFGEPFDPRNPDHKAFYLELMRG